MKKLLLLAAAAVVALGVSAQDTEEPTADTPVYTLKVVQNEVEPKFEQEYSMEATGVMKKDFEVYSITVPMDIMGNSVKPSKYVCSITCTYQGITTTLSAGTLLFYENDTPIDYTVSTYILKVDDVKKALTLRCLKSTDLVAVCDANYRVREIFNPSKTGEPTFGYCNSPIYVELKSAVSLANTTEPFFYEVGKSSDMFTNYKTAAGNGIYKTTLDYRNIDMAYEKASTLELTINHYLPFVCAADVVIPDGVEVFTLKYIPADGDQDSALKAEYVELSGDKKDVLPANTPVIFRVTDAGEYSFAINSDATYTLSSEKAPHYILDSEPENSILVGTHQPHYLPDGCYAINGDDCTRWNQEENTNDKGVVTYESVPAFSSYLKLPEDVAATAPANLAIKYPAPIPTGVENVSASFNNATGKIYNIMGQPVDASYKGIVIRDGKKYIQR